MTLQFDEKTGAFTSSDVTLLWCGAHGDRKISPRWSPGTANACTVNVSWLKSGVSDGYNPDTPST